MRRGIRFDFALAKHWTVPRRTDTRDLPAPQGKTFHELYRETQRSKAQ